MESSKIIFAIKSLKVSIYILDLIFQKCITAADKQENMAPKLQAFSCSTHQSMKFIMKFIMLIKVKMPTVKINTRKQKSLFFSILVFMSS